MCRFIRQWLDYIKTVPPGVRPNYDNLRDIIDSCDSKHLDGVQAAAFAAHYAPAAASPNVGSKRTRSDSDADASADSNDWEESAGETCDEDTSSSMQCEDESEIEEGEEEEEAAPSYAAAPAAKKAKLEASQRED